VVPFALLFTRKSSAKATASARMTPTWSTPPPALATACFRIVDARRVGGDDQAVIVALDHLRALVQATPLDLTPWLEFILLPLFQVFPSTLQADDALKHARLLESALDAMASLVERQPAVFAARADLFSSVLVRPLLALTGANGLLAKDVADATKLAALRLLAALVRARAMPADAVTPESLAHWASLLVDLLQSGTRQRDVYAQALVALKGLIEAVDAGFLAKMLPGASLSLFHAANVNFVPSHNATEN